MVRFVTNYHLMHFKPVHCVDKKYTAVMGNLFAHWQNDKCKIRAREREKKEDVKRISELKM